MNCLKIHTKVYVHMWRKVYSSYQILKEVHNFERLLISILDNFHGFFQFQHALTPSSHYTWKVIIVQIHIATKLLRFLGFLNNVMYNKVEKCTSSWKKYYTFLHEGYIVFTFQII